MQRISTYLAPGRRGRQQVSFSEHQIPELCGRGASSNEITGVEQTGRTVMMAGLTLLLCPVPHVRIFWQDRAQQSGGLGILHRTQTLENKSNSNLSGSDNSTEDNIS